MIRRHGSSRPSRFRPRRPPKPRRALLRQHPALPEPISPPTWTVSAKRSKPWPKPPAAREIVQTLGPGVHGLLGDLVRTIDDALLPSVRTLGRRIQDSEEKSDRRHQDQLDKTLKGLDQLKEPAEALRKIEVEA